MCVEGPKVLQLHLRRISGSEEVVNRVDRLRQKAGKCTRPDKDRATKGCKFCGKEHKYGREKCPAWDRKCTKCQKYNHFATVCKSKVNQVNIDTDYDKCEQALCITATNDEQTEYV